jgi:hypothetical protein
MGVSEAGVERGDFFGGGFAAVEATVGDVIAWSVVRCSFVLWAYPG